MVNFKLEQGSQIIICFLLFTKILSQMQQQTQDIQQLQLDNDFQKNKLSIGQNLDIKELMLGTSIQQDDHQQQILKQQQSIYKDNIQKSVQDSNLIQNLNKQNIQNDVQNFSGQNIMCKFKNERYNDLLQQNETLKLKEQDCQLQLYEVKQQQEQKDWKSNCQKIINVFQNELKKLKQQNLIFQNQLQDIQNFPSTKCNLNDTNCSKYNIQQLLIQNRALQNQQVNNDINCNCKNQNNLSQFQTAYDQQNLQLENQNLQIEVLNLKQQLIDLQNKLQEKQVNNTKNEIGFIVLKPNQMQQNQGSMQQIEILSQKNQDLQDKLQEKEKQIEQLTIKQLEKLQKENTIENRSFVKASLDMQIEALTSQLKTQQFLKLKKEDELLICENNNFTLKQENDNYQKHLLVAKSQTEECYSKMRIKLASNDELKQQLNYQNEENIKLKRNIIQSKLDSIRYQESQQFINQQNDEINKLQQDKQECQKNLKFAQNDIESKKNEIQQKEENLLLIQNQKLSKEEIQKQLQNQLTECNKDLRESKSQILELKQQSNQVSFLQIKIENLNFKIQKQQQEFQEIQNKNNICEKKLIELGEQNDQYQQEILKISIQESQIRELNLQLQEQKQQNMELKQNVNDLENIQNEQKGKLEELAKTKQINIDLNQQIEKQQVEIRNFQTSQNFQFEKFKTIDLLIDRNKDLNIENEKLKDLIEKAQNQNETIILLEQCESELNDIQDQFFQQKLTFIQTQEELSNQQKQFSDLKDDYIKIANQRQNLEIINISLSNNLQRLVSNNYNQNQDESLLLTLISRQNQDDDTSKKDKLMKYANLPEKHHEDIISEKNLNKIKKEKTEQQFDIIKQILQYLNVYSLVLSKPSKDYQFNLPPCYFDFENQDEILEIDMPVFDEQIPRQSLTQEMLDQIEKDGTFKVQSKKFEMDYQWKMADVLIKGKEVVLQQFRRILGFAHQLLIRTQRLFSSGKAVYVMSEGRKYPINIWAALMQIPAFFLNLFSLVMGVPMYRSRTYQIDEEILNEIIKQRNQSIDHEQFQDLIYLANSLQTLPSNKENEKQIKQHNNKVNENIIKLNNFHCAIEKVWKEYYDSQVDLLEDCEEDEYNLQLQEIESQKQKFFLDNFDNIETKLDPKLKKIFKQFFIVKIIVQELQHEKSLRTNKLQDQTVEAIKKENPYLCNVFFWFKHQKKVQFKIIDKQVQQEYETKLIKRLNEQNLIEFKNLYQQILNLMRSKVNKQEKIKLAQKSQIPTDCIIYKTLDPPQRQLNDTSYTKYTFKYIETVYVKTDHYFWRLTYFFKRYTIKVIETARYFSKLFLYGQFGIKGLFGTQDYYQDCSLNYDTGQITYNRSKVSPILQKFKNTMQGIKQSRENFENNPDNAIFGKDVQRIFNYIECYFFRMFIAGILVVLVLHPIINIFMICLYFTLMITSFIYVYLLELFLMICRILLRDTLEPRIDYRMKLSYRKHFYEILLQNFKYFPLFHIIINLLVFGVVQFCHIIFLSYFYPLLSLFTAVFGVIFYYLRSGYDKFTFNFIIKKKAMVPSRDTNLARKIAGPGVSKNLFYTLKIEDSIQLVMAYLEKLKLMHYQKVIIDYLQKDQINLQRNFEQIICPHFGSVQLNIFERQKVFYDYQDILLEEINKRNQQLNFLNKNLSICKIKFTDEDLKQLKESTLDILQNNLKEYLIDDFVWEYTGIAKGHYKRLTCRVLDQVFSGSNVIMESIQATEQRIVMRETQKSQNILSKKHKMINRAIKGDVLLQKFQPRFKHIKTNNNKYIPETNIQNTYRITQSPYAEYKKLLLNLEDLIEKNNIKN